MSIIVKPALEAYAKASDKEWSNDRLQTVGASEVGKCARHVYWSKNEGDEYFGASRDEDYVDGWGHKVRGKVFEDDFWVPAMRARFPYRLMFSGDAQRTFRKGFLTATPDGFLADLTQEEKAGLSIPLDYEGGLAIDCKSVDPRVTELPKPEHVYQVQVQIGLLNESGYPCEYGLIAYTESSDWSNVKEFLVVGDPAIYEQAKIRSQKIMTAESAAELDPEGIVAGGKECGFCPFTKACAELRCSRIPERTWQEKPLPPTQAALLEAHIKSYHDAVDAGEVWEGVATQEKEAIRVILEGAGVRTYKGAGVSVAWSKVAGRKSWDNALIRETLQRVTSASDDVMKGTYQKEGEPSDRLTITVRK